MFTHLLHISLSVTHPTVTPSRSDCIRCQFWFSPSLLFSAYCTQIYLSLDTEEVVLYEVSLFLRIVFFFPPVKILLTTNQILSCFSPSHAMIYLHLLENAPPCQKQFRIKYSIFGPLRCFLNLSKKKTPFCQYIPKPQFLPKKNKKPLVLLTKVSLS